MPLPVPEPGLVVAYAFLWRSEFHRGQEAGTKDRPCAIVITAIDDEGGTIVTVLPVTHTPRHRRTMRSSCRLQPSSAFASMQSVRGSW